jgi:hypothetical protein
MVTQVQSFEPTNNYASAGTYTISHYLQKVLTGCIDSAITKSIVVIDNSIGLQTQFIRHEKSSTKNS